MTINAATMQNLRRKSAFVDTVQLYCDVPLFSLIDFSLTEQCNRSAGHPRACSFCPRIDSKIYPNQNLHMSLKLVEKIARELADLKWAGTSVLCGYGEPLLHPQLSEVVNLLKLATESRVEVVTNGDFLGPEKIAKLSQAGVDYFVVSMYDGPHQVPKFEAAFKTAGVESYILRDRWHSEQDQFGLKLTNRGGVVEVGPQEPVDQHHPCYYLTYQMQVDWNGDVVLCPQDWYKRLRFGNLALQSMFEVWTSKRLNKRRRQLIEGRRVEHPCSSCNTDGTLHGFNHAPLWKTVKL